MDYDEIYDLALNAESTSPIKVQLKEALEVIDSALDSFKCVSLSVLQLSTTTHSSSESSKDELVISFNGGKDCTVLLHLYAAALSKRAVKTRIRAMYIPMPSPYEDLESFIQESVHRYDLDLFNCLPTTAANGEQLPVESVKDGAQRYHGGDGMCKALTVYKEKFPHVEAIFLGTRRSDPHGGE